MVRRRRRFVRPELTDSHAAFVACSETVAEARIALSAAAPSGRAAGVPLAAALAEFEELVDAAILAMPGWRRPEVEDAWRACSTGLEQAAVRAEELRLAGTPQGYEELYGVLDDVMAPLDVFGQVAEAFRQPPG
jgi:hypothetical protein